MKQNSKFNWRKWLRIVHRDLGFFLVGITIVYCISGFVLNHKEEGKDPAYTTTEIVEQFERNLTVEQLKGEIEAKLPNLEFNRIIEDNSLLRLYFKAGLGVYNKEDGMVNIETYKPRPLLKFFNRLHYNRVKHWTWIADFFVFAMLLLVISGLFITPGKKGFAGRGKWYVIAGILLIVLFGLI